MDDPDGLFQLNLTILKYEVTCSRKGELPMKQLKEIMICALLSAPILLFSAPITAQETSSETGQWKPEIDPASKARIEFVEDFWDFGEIRHFIFQ